MRDTKLDPLISAINDLTAYYEYTLITEAGSEAKKYLVNRGLDDALLKNIRLGLPRATVKRLLSFYKVKVTPLKRSKILVF